MWQRLESSVREVLMDSAEGDPEFRESIARASLMSLRAVGALEFTVPLLMLVAGLSVIPVPAYVGRAWLANVLLSGLGALTLAAGWTPLGRRWPRLMTGISIAASACIMAWSVLLLGSEITWIEHHLLGYTTLVMFGAAAAVPLRAVHTLLLGLALDVIYIVSVTAADVVGLGQHVFVLVITLLCAALTGSVYRTRYRNYLAHQNALRTSEELHKAQSRLLISDNAAVMGRVAAALSHELNSPIGVLTSAVDTLAAVAQRVSTAAPAEQERLRRVVTDVQESGKQSAKRLQEIVSRIQRFTNLDRAEFQPANLNNLLTDVIALTIAERGEASRQIVTDFHTIPQFPCRPQQLSAVFSNLLGNALEALNSNGRVRVSTRSVDWRIEVRFEDNGRGIPPDQISTLFDPAAFHVSQGRMRAGNWSLFSCRQIVQQHGGDVEITSGESGTSVTVVLPAVGK